MINQNSIQREEPVLEPVPDLFKLDLACGDAEQEGFVGVDIVKTESADIVHDLRELPWPFDDDEIDEARCSHFFEHLEPMERVRFMNELHRVLKPGAGCVFITPLGHDRQVQDFTHKWPPIVLASYYYFDMEWLKENNLMHYAELHGIECNFEPRPMQMMVAPEFATRSDEHKLFAARNYMNGPSDLVMLMVKRGGTK